MPDDANRRLKLVAGSLRDCADMLVSEARESALSRLLMDHINSLAAEVADVSRQVATIERRERTL
jgi:hypothetical protein